MTEADLVYNDIIQFGTFTLSSGQKSDVYFNMRKAYGIPELREKIIHYIVSIIKKEILNNKHAFFVTGVPESGKAWATIIADRLKLPLLVPRLDKEFDKNKHIKTYEHLSSPPVEGLSRSLSSNDKLIVIEDVITTGKSALDFISQAFDAHKSWGAFAAITIYDRCLGNNCLSGWGKHYSLMPKILPLCDKLLSLYANTKQEVYNKLHNIVMTKNTSLILSLDYYKDHMEIGNILSLTEHLLAGVKIHLDIYSNDERDAIRGIINLYRKSLFIIEDKKFTDIGHINKLQCDALLVEEYADAVTCMPNPGMRSLDAIPLPKILVRDMSSNPHDDHRTHYDKLMPVNDIIGAVTQKREKSNLFLTFRTGVTINEDEYAIEECDDMGQIYTQPSNADADFFILGRRFTQSGNIIEKLENAKYLFT